METAVNVFYSFILGAVIGSFLGAAFFRIKNRQSMRGRSRCPQCGEQIRVVDNIPIFSFVFLKGKSRCCKTKISPHYFIFEIICAFVFALIGALGGIYLAFAVAATIILLILIFEIRL